MIQRWDYNYDTSGKKKLKYTKEARTANLLAGSIATRFKKGHVPANKGIPHSEETKTKIRAKRAVQPPAN